MHPLSDHEQLINSRLTWLAAFSGFLVTAVALGVNTKQSGSLVFAICVLGALVAAATFLGTLAANLILWERAKAENWPRRWMFWLLPGNTLPPLVLAWWVVLAAILPSSVSGPALSAAITVSDTSTPTLVMAIVGAVTGCTALVASILQEIRHRRADKLQDRDDHPTLIQPAEKP
jgi:hypothetical protein